MQDTTIWKYPLRLTQSQSIEMPQDAKILCVNLQMGVPCIWAEVIPDTWLERRFFEVIGTGHPIAAGMGKKYLGTVFTPEGFVWHIFEKVSS